MQPHTDFDDMPSLPRPLPAPAASPQWSIDPTAIDDPVLADPADWPAEQLWLHPDGTLFGEHREAVEAILRTRLAEVPPMLRVGPLGCATAPNVLDFLRDGQPDRAWRLAARLCLATGALGSSAWNRQRGADLAVSAFLLAGEVHGCALGAVEAIALLGDLAERAAAGELAYPGLPVIGTPLAIRIRRRREVALERLAARIAIDASPEGIESLFWRAPVLMSRTGDKPGLRLW
jgi:hypothetical protein